MKGTWLLLSQWSVPDSPVSLYVVGLCRTWPLHNDLQISSLRSKDSSRNFLLNFLTQSGALAFKLFNVWFCLIWVKYPLNQNEVLTGWETCLGIFASHLSFFFFDALLQRQISVLSLVAVIHGCSNNHKGNAVELQFLSFDRLWIFPEDSMWFRADIYWKVQIR